MKNICICGGGNLGHVVGGYLAAKPNTKVSLLTGHPRLWAKQLIITLPDSSYITGNLTNISDNPEDSIPYSDIVIICLPGMYIREEIQKIKPYLRPNTIVGSIVSSTGFFFQAHDIIPRQPIFGFQRVPFISRIEEYGHKANLLGTKTSLKVVIENFNDVETLRSLLSDLFSVPVELLDNYLEVSLSNSNPLLHTSRLYSMWSNWHDGVYYPRQSLFYEEWTPEAAQLYIDMDNEFQHLLDELGVRKGAIPPVLNYYESHDAISLCNKISSIKAFKGIKSPMIHTEKGWIPDVNSRYFKEDFGYGLRFIHSLALKNHIDAMFIKKVYAWGNKMIK